MVRIVIDETVTDRLPALRGVIPDCNIPLSEEEFHYDGDYILDRTLQLIADGTYIEIPTIATSRVAHIWAYIATLLILLLAIGGFLYRRKR